MTAPARQISPEPEAEAPTAKPVGTVWSILTSLTSGGAEMLVAGLNRHFVKNGWKHHVVVLCDAAELGNSSETEGWLKDRIERDGGKVSSLRLARSRNPFSGGAALNRLLKGAGSPDVVHSHTARAIPILALSRYRGPICMTHHNSRLSFPKKLFPLLDALVDEYVAISPETAAIYAEASRRPVTAIANGPDDDFLASEPRKAMHSPARVISVGAISDQKNYDLLIEIARHLEDAGAVRFSIAGGGAQLDDFRQKSTGLPVEFMGERKDVPDLLDDADIFLNTSHFEGQSVAILEALSKALPVIATDVPGNRDLVRNGENGFLCAIDDPRALAAAIERLIANPAEYRDISAGALASGQRFSIADTAEKHVALYSRLAALKAGTTLKG